jgi:predicted transcriptional regulator
MTDDLGTLAVYRPDLLRLRQLRDALSKRLSRAQKKRLQDDERDLRQQLVWRFSAELAWTQQQIASFLEVSQATVCRDLAAVNAEIHERLAQMVETEKLLQVAQLKHMASQLLEAWEASKAPLQEVTETKIVIDGEQPEQAIGRQVRTRVRGREGDRGYLAEARACLADIRKILGADAPIEIKAVTGDGEAVESTGILIVLPDNGRDTTPTTRAPMVLSLNTS